MSPSALSKLDAPDATEPADAVASSVVAVDTDAHAAARAKLGLQLGGYVLEEVLGVGGTACVYRGAAKDGRRVAIKVLHGWLSADLRARKRFLREAVASSRILHSAIVRILDQGEEPDGTAYLVMELAEGQTVEARRVAQGGRLATDEVLRIANELLDVLASVHAQGVVHRDIKPANLLLTSSGSLRVLDFGIARVTDLSDTASIVTRTGAVMGTIFFMAPEQALGVREDIDARSDVWAVGATIFTLLTGQFVHRARSVNEALVLAATQPAPRIRSVDPAIAAPLAAVIDRALQFDRAARYTDAAAMHEALERAMRGEMEAAEVVPVETLPETTLPERNVPAQIKAKPRSRTGFALTGVVVAAILGGGAVLILLVGASLSGFVDVKPGPNTEAQLQAQTLQTKGAQAKEMTSESIQTPIGVNPPQTLSTSGLLPRESSQAPNRASAPAFSSVQPDKTRTFGPVSSTPSASAKSIPTAPSPISPPTAPKKTESGPVFQDKFE